MICLKYALRSVRFAFAAALLPTLAFAEIHVLKTVDHESIVVKGPEIESLSVGQRLRMEADGSVGTITRTRGQKALVSVQSSEQIQAGDRVLLVRSSQRAGIIPADSGSGYSERRRSARSSGERSQSGVRLSVLAGLNRPMASLPKDSDIGSPSHSFSLLPELAISVPLMNGVRIQGSGSLVSKSSSATIGDSKISYTASSFQAGVDFQVAPSNSPLMISAGSFLAFPTSLSAKVDGERVSLAGSGLSEGRKTDLGVQLGIGFSAPVGSNVEFVGMARYAHGFLVKNTDDEEKTRDARVVLGLAFGL
jgi:hypothetical protein